MDQENILIQNYSQPLIRKKKHERDNVGIKWNVPGQQKFAPFYDPVSWDEAEEEQHLSNQQLQTSRILFDMEISPALQNHKRALIGAQSLETEDLHPETVLCFEHSIFPSWKEDQQSDWRFGSQHGYIVIWHIEQVTHIILSCLDQFRAIC